MGWLPPPRSRLRTRSVVKARAKTKAFFFIYVIWTDRQSTSYTCSASTRNCLYMQHKHRRPVTQTAKAQATSYTETVPRGKLRILIILAQTCKLETNANFLHVGDCQQARRCQAALRLRTCFQASMKMWHFRRRLLEDVRKLGRLPKEYSKERNLNEDEIAEKKTKPSTPL